MILEKKGHKKGEILKQLGERLRQQRLRNGLTQEELAEKAGFSRSYYTEVETGKRNISILNTVRLAVALNVPLKELMDFELK